MVNKRLNYIILTNDITFLIINTATPLTINTATSLTVNTVIRVKSTLYIVNLDIGLWNIQRIKRTEEYINISPILRAATAILTIMMTIIITKGIPSQQNLEFLTFTLI